MEPKTGDLNSDFKNPGYIWSCEHKSDDVRTVIKTLAIAL